MKLKFILGFALFIVVLGFSNFKKRTPRIPKYFPQPIYNYNANPYSPDKMLLGRVLFYDPILSRNNKISCASCHTSFSAFTHVDHALSHGIDDKIGTRNAPALFNLGWQSLFMWDGAINHLDVQALAPLHNPIEMDEDISHVVSKLQSTTMYPALFYKAFGDSAITGEHTLKAISQFMLSLVSCQSRYDSVRQNLATFTEQENSGYQLYKQHCSSCHTEPLFTNNTFMNNGLALDTLLKDIGRFRISKIPSDSLKFKVPSLRNIEYTYPYMHDGRFKYLKQVIDHYTSGIVHSSTLATELSTPISLSANEKTDIIAFLLTLSDRKFIFNPQHTFPKEILLK